MASKSIMDRCLLIQNVINYGDEDIHKMNENYKFQHVQTEESPRISKLNFDTKLFDIKKKPESQRAILDRIKRTKSKIFSDS